MRAFSEAWVVGLRLPAFIGYTGVSASAWMFKTVGGWDGAAIKAFPSRAADGGDWRATVMAVRGVIDDATAGSNVVVLVALKALAESWASNFRRSDGTPSPQFSAYNEAAQCALSKDLRIELRYCSPDAHYARLREQGRNEAKRKIESLGEEAFTGARPERDLSSKPRRKPEINFPTGEGFVDHPKRIFRNRP